MALKFEGGFGQWEAYSDNFRASIRTVGFGRVKRYKLWVDGEQRGQFNTYQQAKQVAERAYALKRTNPARILVPLATLKKIYRAGRAGRRVNLTVKV